LGFCFRLNWLLTHTETLPVVWTDEFSYYISSAINAFRGHGFVPDYNKTAGEVFVPPPMQSIFILFFYEVFNRVINPFWLKLVQVVLNCGALTLLLPEIVRRIYSEKAALVCSFASAIFPPFVHWPSYLMTESNYLVGLTILIWLIMRWVDDRKLSDAVLVGGCLGLLNLQRGNAFFLGIVLAIFGLWFIEGKAKFKHAAVLIILPYLVMAPWFIRNLNKYGDPVWVSSHDGIMFHFANRITLDSRKVYYWEIMWAIEKPGPFLPQIESEFRDQRKVLPSEFDVGALNLAHGGQYHPLKVTAYRYSEAYYRVAKNYIFHHPFHFLRNYFYKGINQFVLRQDIPRFSVPFLSDKMVYSALHWFVLLAGLFGFAWSLFCTSRMSLKVFCLIFLYFSFMGAFFHLTADGRMNLFLKEFLIVFLSIALTPDVKKCGFSKWLANRSQK